MVVLVPLGSCLRTVTSAAELSLVVFAVCMRLWVCVYVSVRGFPARESAAR
jgi:hypothetical protein